VKRETGPSWSSVISVVFLALAGFSGIAPAQENYQTYVNARFAYSISYPANVLFPQGESENGDGQRFLSKDGRAELRVWGAYNVLNENLKDAYERESSITENPGRTVLYRLLKRDWFVISGTENGRIFYQKTMLKGEVHKEFRIEYAESDKSRFEQVVKRIEKSFRG